MPQGPQNWWDSPLFSQMMMDPRYQMQAGMQGFGMQQPHPQEPLQPPPGPGGLLGPSQAQGPAGDPQQAWEAWLGG